jgi:hypothetical protein
MRADLRTTTATNTGVLIQLQSYDVFQVAHGHTSPPPVRGPQNQTKHDSDGLPRHGP